MTHHAETLHDAVEEVFRAAGAVVLEEQQRRQGEKYEFDEKTAAAIAREPVNLVAAAVLIATQMAAPKGLRGNRRTTAARVGGVAQRPHHAEGGDHGVQQTAGKVPHLARAVRGGVTEGGSPGKYSLRRRKHRNRRTGEWARKREARCGSSAGGPART